MACLRWHCLHLSKIARGFLLAWQDWCTGETQGDCGRTGWTVRLGPHRWTAEPQGEVPDVISLTVGNPGASWIETLEAADVNWIEGTAWGGRKSQEGIRVSKTGTKIGWSCRRHSVVSQGRTVSLFIFSRRPFKLTKKSTSICGILKKGVVFPLKNCLVGKQLSSLLWMNITCRVLNPPKTHAPPLSFCINWLVWSLNTSVFQQLLQVIQMCSWNGQALFYEVQAQQGTQQPQQHQQSKQPVWLDACYPPPAAPCSLSQGPCPGHVEHLDLPKIRYILSWVWSLSLLSSLPWKALLSWGGLADPYSYQRPSDIFSVNLPSSILVCTH